jgi:RNA polymerase sigma-70 factor, ECF subfamily
LDPSVWVDKHGDYLYRFALLRLRNQSKAEDVVQETMLAALSGRQSFSGQSTVRTWLTGILKHKIMDQFRAVHREHRLNGLFNEDDSIDDLYDSRKHLNPPAQAWKGNPEKAFEQGEFQEQLKECLKKLPKRQASIFALREMDGCSSEEICKELTLTSTNYWVLLHRSRVALRRCFEINWFGLK